MKTLETPLAEFSADDVDSVVEQELSEASKFCSQKTSPTAILLAGQPGAGKTMLSAMLSKNFQGDVFAINADEYRRYHPNRVMLFKEFGAEAVSLTTAFSSVVTERLIDALSNRRINLIIEGTGRTVDVPSETARLLKEKGYQVELAAMAVRPELSLLSTLLRFYEMADRGTLPRPTAIEAHDHVVSVLPENLDILNADTSISRLTIWTRDLKQIFDSFESTLNPGAALSQYWNRPWYEAEIQAAEEQIALLREKELEYHLGQDSAVEEVERRIMKAPLLQEQESFGMTMM